MKFRYASTNAEHVLHTIRQLHRFHTAMRDLYISEHRFRSAVRVRIRVRLEVHTAAALTPSQKSTNITTIPSFFC